MAWKIRSAHPAQPRVKLVRRTGESAQGQVPLDAAASRKDLAGRKRCSEASCLEKVDRNVRTVLEQRLECDEVLIDQIHHCFFASDGGVAACGAFIGPNGEQVLSGIIGDGDGDDGRGKERKRRE